MNEKKTSLLTIGHSTRPLDEFVALLLANDVSLLVDVRSIPRSQHNPQFNNDTLPAALAANGIGYLHMPELGGLKKAQPESVNTGWKNPGFRGYADYMAAAEFAAGLDRLLELAASERIAIMCAEAVPWRCHRSLISDAAVARGVEVRHIMGRDSTQPHRLTPFAKIDGTKITYPA